MTEIGPTPTRIPEASVNLASFMYDGTCVYSQPMVRLIICPILSVVIGLACVAPPANPETDTGSESGDGAPIECDAGLTACCLATPAECASPDEWGCVDTTSDNSHCGECGNYCPTDKLVSGDIVPTACIESVCEPTLGSCREAQDMTCDAICALDEETCVEQGCHGNTMFLYGEGSYECTADTLTPESFDIACDELPPPTELADAVLMACCCE